MVQKKRANQYLNHILHYLKIIVFREEKQRFFKNPLSQITSIFRRSGCQLASIFLAKVVKNPPKIDFQRHQKNIRFSHRFLYRFCSNLEPSWASSWSQSWLLKITQGKRKLTPGYGHKSHQPSGLGWFRVGCLFSTPLLSTLLVATLWGGVYHYSLLIITLPRASGPINPTSFAPYQKTFIFLQENQYFASPCFLHTLFCR